MKVLACLALLAATGSAADRYAVDWDKLQPKITERFSALVRIATTNPPGNETKAAKAIQAALEREGIACKLLAADPDRANLVARIRGNGSKKPLLILGHADTVGVQREKWSVDPFSALVRNGYI